MMKEVESPISSGTENPQNSMLANTIVLELSGKMVEFDESILNELPESIIILLFPTGVVNSKISKTLPHQILTYILEVYRGLKKDGALKAKLGKFNLVNEVPYFKNNALIMLKEELDFYPIITAPECKENLQERDFTKLESHIDAFVYNNKHIFGAIKKTSKAEEQLISMLTATGFDRDEHWDVRTKCAASSRKFASIIMKDLLITDASVKDGHPQKLFLFYKKPARKCWWYKNSFTVNLNHSQVDVILWMRVVWTLELVIL